MKDLRKSECPSCKATLNKIPGRKKKCEQCGEYMYVRTRPEDNARVLVDKRGADLIDEEWAIQRGMHDEYIAEKNEYERERVILRKRFGKEPSENDVMWGVLNKRIIKSAKKGDGLLFRVTRFEMGEILRKEKKYNDALVAYFEVCYIDLCDQYQGLAPGIIERINNIRGKEKVDINKVKNTVFERVNMFKNTYGFSLTIDEAWKKFEKEIIK